MSIGAIGGVSVSRQSLVNMANQNIYFYDVPSQPQPQPQLQGAAAAILMQVLLQITQAGGSNLGQGGGQRGGRHHGGSADAAHGNEGAGAAEAALESQGVEAPLDGTNGLLDAISGLLAAIAPLLGGMGGDSHPSTTDDASHLAGLLSASGF